MVRAIALAAVNARGMRAVILAAMALCSSGVHAQCPTVFRDGFDGLVSASKTMATSDGVTHTYFYRIPYRAAPVDGRPLLFWLHGDGGSGNGYGSGFYPYTDADSAILITPSGINATWSHYAADVAGKAQDAQFISRIIDDVLANGLRGQCVDEDRIYIGGESRGAYMPYFLLQRPSTQTRFAAVAMNAGSLYCQSGDANCNVNASSPVNHSAPTPFLHLHGTNDSSVPPPIATFHNPINWSVDWNVFWPMRLWAQQHGCYGGDNATGHDSGVVRETYLVGANTATRYDLSGWGPDCDKYQLILVQNGGHVIGGQHQRIWNFLKAHNRLEL
ncbi:MAG: hypothetical protein ABI411_13685 [Tahibacter sp.]